MHTPCITSLVELVWVFSCSVFFVACVLSWFITLLVHDSEICLQKNFVARALSKSLQNTFASCNRSNREKLPCNCCNCESNCAKLASNCLPSVLIASTIIWSAGSWASLKFLDSRYVQFDIISNAVFKALVPSASLEFTQKEHHLNWILLRTTCVSCQGW